MDDRGPRFGPRVAPEDDYPSQGSMPESDPDTKRLRPTRQFTRSYHPHKSKYPQEREGRERERVC